MFRFYSVLFLCFFCITCKKGATLNGPQSGGDSTTATAGAYGCIGGCQYDRSHLDEYLKSRKIAQRLEYVRQQLVSNLGADTSFEDTPRLSPLPEFLVEQLLRQQQPQKVVDADELKSHHTQKKQMVVFPDEENANCYSTAKNSLCLRFKLTDEILMADISSASLWLNEEYFFFNGASTLNFTIIDSDSLNSHYRRKYRRKCSIRENGEWCRNNVTDIFKSWQISKNVKQAMLVVTCDTCSNRTVKKELRIQEKDKIPFLLLNAEIEKNSRSKRGVDCDPGSNECCRENLEIDFGMLGNYKMIVYPSKFNVYMCRGNCYYHSAAMVEKPYASLMVMLKANNTGKYSLPTSCCTPTRFSNLQIIYASDNSTYSNKEIPNLIVESCGCI